MSTCGATLICGEVILQLLVYGLSNGAVLALNAIGVTVIYGTIRTLNLAHGDVFALTSVLVTTLIADLGVQANWPPLQLVGVLALGLTAAMIFGALLNVAIDRVAFKPFRGRSRLAPLIATLGLSFILYQVALIWRTTLHSWVPGDHRSVPGLPEVPMDRIPDLLPNVDLVKALGLSVNVTFRFSDLFILLVAVILTFAVTLFLNRTSTGRAFRAISQNATLAQICGVPLDATISRAFAFSGALAGSAAFVFALYYARPFGNHGAQSGLLAFTAAILGGIGNPVGALISALIIGVFSSFSDYFLLAQWTPVLLQILLITLLVLRPASLTAGEAESDNTSQLDSVMLASKGQTSPRQRRWLWVFAAFVMVFPLIDSVSGLGLQVIATSIGIFILLALGLNFLLGSAGVLDLGYAVSFGIGGYLTALITGKLRTLGYLPPQPLDFIIVMLFSALCAGLFGALKGRLTVRLRPDYLAVVTLALGLLLRQTAVNLKEITGGTGGIPAVPPPRIFSFPIAGITAQYYLVFVITIIAVFAMRRLITSPIGRAWLAASEDETAAEATGINVARYKTLAMMLSSAIAGVAGSLYAGTLAYVSPQMLDFQTSAMLLAMVILGGAGSVPGAIVGAALIMGYNTLLIPKLGALLALLQPSSLNLGYAPDLRGASYFTFGLALYLTVLIRARRKNEPQ